MALSTKDCIHPLPHPHRHKGIFAVGLGNYLNCFPSLLSYSVSDATVLRNYQGMAQCVALCCRQYFVMKQKRFTCLLLLCTTSYEKEFQFTVLTLKLPLTSLKLFGPGGQAHSVTKDYYSMPNHRAGKKSSSACRGRR